MIMPGEFELEINGTPFRIEARGQCSLLDVLRDQLHLTGSKRGCETGECGACTVLLDDAPVCACLVMLGACQGRRVVTIEGLSKGGQLHPLQQAFLDKGAIACGFCTPGMIMAAVALLSSKAPLTRQDIQRGLRGNLCACGAFEAVVEVVEAFSERTQIERDS